MAVACVLVTRCPCSLPAARMLHPGPMHCLCAGYPPPTCSLSATEVLAIRRPRARYLPPTCLLPALPCPRYPLHTRSMAVPRVLDGRCPCIRYPPPARLIPALVHSLLAPHAQSLPPPPLPGPSIPVPCTPDGGHLCARCLPLRCSLVPRHSPLGPYPMRARPSLPAHSLPAVVLCPLSFFFFATFPPAIRPLNLFRADTYVIPISIPFEPQ
jgi:hypothetical protein